MLSLSPPPLPPPFVDSLPLVRPPPRRLLHLAAKRRAEDGYHATIRTLNANGRRHTPRKSLGQHYMLIAGVNDALASVAGVEEGDVVLEIGPGTGSLTNALINAGATVIAVEKDPHMAMLVKARFASTDRLTVVSNIPFNISTEVVKQLLPLGDVFSDVALLLQINSAFNGERKMLRKSLHHICPSIEIEAALTNIGLPVTSRPGELSLADFVRLHNLLVKVCRISYILKGSE